MRKKTLTAEVRELVTSYRKGREPAKENHGGLGPPELVRPVGTGWRPEDPLCLECDQVLIQLPQGFLQPARLSPALISQGKRVFTVSS